MSTYDKALVESFTRDLVEYLDQEHGEKTPVVFTDNRGSYCKGTRNADDSISIVRLSFSHKLFEYDMLHGFLEYATLRRIVASYRPGPLPTSMEAVYWIVIHEYAHAVQMREDSSCDQHGKAFVLRYTDLLVAYPYAKVAAVLCERNAAVRISLTKTQLRGQVRHCRSTGSKVQFLDDAGELRQGKLLKSTNGVYKVTDLAMTKVWTVDAQAIEFCGEE